MERVMERVLQVQPYVTFFEREVRKLARMRKISGGMETTCAACGVGIHTRCHYGNNRVAMAYFDGYIICEKCFKRLQRTGSKKRR